MAADPWFSAWNYDLLRTLFRLIPHTQVTDDFCEMLLLNPLLSTWVFAACTYRFWTKEDEQQERRRRCLVSAVVAFGLAGMLTIVVRPWIHWPAPALNPHFQPLFPRDFWGNGSGNCFPSHSTLAYFTVAAGFWPLHRRLSLCLSAMALCFVSFPRMYVGGHYPIDVLFSCLLGVAALIAVRRWPIVASAHNWQRLRKSPQILRDLIFFLWLFELGEGFHGLEGLANAAHRAFWSR